MAIEVKQESGDGSVVIEDSRGRKLTVKEPEFLMEARVAKICGDASTNVGYMYAYVFPAVWVVKIDDNPVPFPGTMLELEALISRVGRDGAAAVIAHMSASKAGHAEEVKN